MKRLVPTVWGFTLSRLAASPTVVGLSCVWMYSEGDVRFIQIKHTRGHANTLTVRDLDEVLGVDEEVARLDVPVDFPLRV